MKEDDEMGREDARNALFPLMIPTYDGSGEAAHPSVLYFTNRWNNYCYWMAFTPYRGTNEKYENPSVVVSNDGIHWVQPKELTNPIVRKPEDGHLSDPNLFFDFHNRLSMFYRKRYRLDNGRGYDEIFAVYSKDGIHWSPPKSVLVGDQEKGAAQLLSPAMALHLNKYYLYTVNYNKKIIQLRISDNLEGLWSNPIDILLIKNLPDNITPWHINVVKHQADFEFVIVMKDKKGLEPNSLHYGRSNDGKSILLYNKPILCPSKIGWDNEIIYQGSLVPSTDSKSLDSYFLYYSARGKNKIWSIGRTMIEPNKLEF